MPDIISKYILASNLVLDDIEQIVNDKQQTITIKRQGTTGNGFSADLADYASVGSIAGRIDNVDSFVGKYVYKTGANQDVKGNENTFIGVALLTAVATLGVRIGDIWNDGTYDYRVQEFIGIRQSKVEVVLKMFNEIFPVI